jgi:putative ABC transport system permease protein
MPEWKEEITKRLARLKLAPVREAAIVEELSQHLDDRYRELVAGGTAEDEARRVALEELSDEELLARGLRPVEQKAAPEPVVFAGGGKARNFLASIGQDVRYGLRQLRRNPGFTAVAILTLALGIGANAAIFQLIDAVRLRTVPAKDPRTLAIVHLNNNQWRMGIFEHPYGEFNYPLWQQIRKRQEAFSSVAAWGSQTLDMAAGGKVDNANAIWVSGEFFTVIGVEPLLGRLISPSDDQQGCAGGLDLSYAFWQQRYGGAASVIGRTLTLNGHPFPILGVTPPGFYGVAVGQRFDVAVPICTEPVIQGEGYNLVNGGARFQGWLSILGRLKPGWTVKRASAQLVVIAPAALKETLPPQANPDDFKHYLAYKFEAVPGANGFSNLRHTTDDPLLLLLGLSGLVLLIACANLANLMLARASAREREISVRLALGAGRGRLIRQLLSESALLAIAGAACGGLLAAALSRSAIALISTPNNPIFLDMPVDWRVVGFIAGLAILTVVLFGLLPAWRAGSAPPGSVLKGAGRGMTAGRGRFRLQRIFVVSQVALSLVLLAGALLFARSLQKLLTRRLGFQQNRVLIANLYFERLNLPAAHRSPLVHELLDRIRAVPGVAAAAASERSPASGYDLSNAIQGRNGAPSRGWAYLDFVSPGYFQTMEISLLAGRDFNDNDGDSATSPLVTIVNQAFVRKFLGGSKNAVGMHFRFEAPRGVTEPYYSVVGVVENSVYEDVHAPFKPVIYLPQSRIAWELVTFLIRSKAGMAGLINSVNSAIVGVNPEIDIQFVLLREQIRDSLVQDELMTALCGFFGGLALLLAAIGLYGVISYTVGQRTNEIGIRMALGAERARIIRLILGEVSSLVGVGIFIGAFLTLAGGKAAGSLLYGLKADDPLTLALAVMILAAVGLVASFVPARRASRLDPMVALRYE